MQINIEIAGLPFTLVCDSGSGYVAFVPRADFKDIFDEKASFNTEWFKIEGNKYEWNTLYPYKNIKGMLEWLQRQHLEMPNIFKG